MVGGGGTPSMGCLTERPRWGRSDRITAVDSSVFCDGMGCPLAVSPITIASIAVFCSQERVFFDSFDIC
ncbi:hypothetical protein BHE74_00008190 [Ensete ventricosum]|nr:hypothetical protein BHE74_00008190 [Ensete ventricosum]RZR99050.1 hypothetical protein BHM03_00028521 [Ensete ventricosum]